MISMTAEYALRAIAWMAGREDTAVGTRDIAEATQVPVGYMSKVLQGLAKAGLVRSRPGRTGGFVLGRPATVISVLDIIQAVDPIHRVERCPLGRSQHQGRLCPLHRRLDQAVALVEQAFGSTTIAQLSAEAAQEQVLCAAQVPTGEGPEVS
jgi:Rrf2 family transcriptional regulator, nitric oxide-sensitive transcriptional repressor